MTTSLPGRAIARLKRSWGKSAFDRTAMAIMDTAPLPVTGPSPLFVSMLCHRDLAAYLLAIKSLYLRVGQGRVAVIDDGSLTQDDARILRHHIPGLEIIGITTIDTGACPRGGAWERLVKVIELSRETYVIQADADTLASEAVPEVVDCWQNNRSFLLGTNVGQQVLPVPQTAQMVRSWIETYQWRNLTVGVAAEAAMDRIVDAASRFYVHASAGFAGFAAGSCSLPDLENFSREMAALVGRELWNRWGSEQIASNYILANARDAVVLPFPRYACFEPQLQGAQPDFTHFIGTHRYDGGIYRRRAAAFIRSCGR